VGASGVDFFPEPAGLTPAERRDVVLLGSLATALDALAGPDYAAAFGGSTNPDDYRWGRLHRLTLPSVIGEDASIPPAGGFESLAPSLPGLARDGGPEAVNVGGFIASGSSASTFTFSFGSQFRTLLAPAHPDARPDGVLGFSSLPGGPSGDPTSPLYVSQLGKWLTVDHDRMLVNARDVRAAATRVELFEPPAP
jgi:penicillin amidase